ncbi:MAG: fdhA [Phycisphaerales bacterium]|jgi:formate dehydrogenase major subunit|nr:fdhA [Phycisphaerales bacterium]MDB5357254.1 fdhA [Phycisphaerales bacterium]
MKLPLFSSARPSNGRKHNGVQPRPPQPYSEQSLDKHSRLKGATRSDSVCPYCAVGCSTHVYTKAGVVIDIEGNPNSPINEGTLCPKGANIFQIGANPHRVRHAMYRAPFSDRWQQVPLHWAMDQIAQRVKKTRDEGYQEKSQSRKGQYLNAVLNMGCLGGATLDIEENFLMKKLFSAGLQIVSIENQARI